MLPDSHRLLRFTADAAADQIFIHPDSCRADTASPGADRHVRRTDAVRPVRLRDVKPIPAYLLSMKADFEENYAENHSLEYFEQTLGISRYRLCREFSATFHTSPLQYLQGKKIEAAKSLLLSTDNPIHEVGAMVGIDNTNHFIHLFKKHTGVTPFVYRQNAPQSIRETHCPSVPVGLPPR